MLSPRVMRWSIAAAIVAVLVVAVLIALPYVVRHFAIQRVEAMTGRDVTIGDVDLNVFTRRIVFTDVRIASPGEAPPLATSPRVEASFQLLPFFRGRTVLEHVAIVEPVVHVVRQEAGTLSIEDVVEHWQARPAGEPVEARLDGLVVRDGRVVFDDRAVEPAREWVAKDLGIEASAITTMSDAATGQLSAAFDVAGGRATVDVTNLRVRPLAAHARIGLEGIDVAPLDAYQAPDAPIVVAGGQLTTNLVIDYAAEGLLRGEGRGTLRDVVLRRPGQDPAFVTVPVATLAVDGLTWAKGALALRDAVFRAAQATVFDASAARARPLEVRDIEAAFHDAAVDGPEGRLTLRAALPGDGTLEATGTGTLLPPAGDLAVDVRGLDAALAQIWMPPDAAVTPTAGEIGASLALRYAKEPGLHVGGRVWATDLAIAPAGQDVAIVTDERVEVTVTDLVVDDGGAGFGNLRLVASPTIVPRGPPTSVTLQELVVSAADARFPGKDPTQIDARIVMPHGGLITASGQAQLAVPSAALDVAVKDVDAMLAAPYLPPDAAVTFDNGRLDARLDVAWRDGLHVDGRATVRALTVQWQRQDAPLVEHARLDVEVAGLTVRGGALALDRVTLTGSPTIVDATASPPQRFEIQRLRLTASDVTWPGQAPMKVEGLAETADGGTATLKGTFDISTLATDVRLDLGGIDVTRARGYIPQSAPIILDGGQAQGTVRLQHTRGTVRIDAEGAFQDLAIALTTGTVVPITDERVTFAIEDLVLKDGSMSLGRAVVDGSPQVAHGHEPAPAFPLHAELRAFSLPSGPPADFTITARPGDGRIEINGAFAPANRSIEARIDAENAAIAPFAALIPVDAPVRGRLDAQLEVTVRPANEAALALRGGLAVHNLSIGPDDTAPLVAQALRVENLALEGRSIDVGRLVLEAPSVLVEREQDGSFPLRAMLTPNGAGSAAPRETPPDDRPAGSQRAGGDDGASPWRIDVDEARITGGSIRFIDRTSRPFYSEEITRLETTIRDLSNVDQGTAGLTIQGIVGADAALELNGEIAPFAEPFFLEVSGTLRDFSVPRTNPLLRRFLDWIANRGELTTQVHYRIVGDELTATNELVVRRLDVERTRNGDRAEQLVGLPLGLVVSLLKDASGTIRFTLPVSGELGSPKFSFGDAIKSALKNVIGRLVTSPFRAIGSVFRRGDDGDIEDLRVNPVTFPAGSAVLTPDAATHLQRVADFLRASPYIRLALEPVVSEQDLLALRAAEVTARIQRVQREQGVEDFMEAAHRVWRATMPKATAPPEDAQAIVRALAEREPPPTEAARQLAERRASVTRTHLVDDAGIAGDRLLSATGAPPIGAEGEGRVAFSLEPQS